MKEGDRIEVIEDDYETARTGDRGIVNYQFSERLFEVLMDKTGQKLNFWAHEIQGETNV